MSTERSTLYQAINGREYRKSSFSSFLPPAHCVGVSFDGLAADNPPHRRVEAEPVGIVHVVVAAKASENGLTELPDKTVATILPTTGVRECVPGNLGQSESIIQFPVRQQPGVGSDLGTVELKLQAAVKIEPQNPRFRFTHRVGHINTQNPPIT